MNRTAIIDYGMSNLDSVRRAFEECGAEAFITDNPRALRKAGKGVLPGVGSFKDGMNVLREKGWEKAIRDFVKDKNKYFLGICLGMQMLATSGEEGGETAGLNLIKGKVIRFKPGDKTIRIPHVGWNEVFPSNDCKLFKGIEPGRDFYFVHSYNFVCENDINIGGYTPYCGGFVSAVYRDNVFGVQFHPEKSQRIGFRLIKNFLAL